MERLVKSSDIKETKEDGLYIITNNDTLYEIKEVVIKKIALVIKENKWNQSYAAKLLEVDQPKISQIKHCKIDGFSLERLLKFAVLLGIKISIQIK